MDGAQPKAKLGFNATWSMAVGGMTGGGIFSTRGVVVGIAGHWAWLSFSIGGLVVVTIAAAFSTGSAINARLFAAARLAHTVAEDGEPPAALNHKNSAGIPDRAIIGLGTAAAILAAVCALAFRQRAGRGISTGLGALTAFGASVALIVRLVQTDPLALVLLGLLVNVAVFGRPILLRYVESEPWRGRHRALFGRAKRPLLRTGARRRGRAMHRVLDPVTHLHAGVVGHGRFGVPEVFWRAGRLHLDALVP